MLIDFQNRTPLFWLVCVGMIGFGWCNTLPLVHGHTTPNMIVFIADDVSWNDFGCYGNKKARTPHIDRLAETGLRFDNAFLTASSCSPSRASIVTGRYPHNNGKAAELHLPIDPRLPWFPQRLREKGYYTALVGKNHMKKGPSTDTNSPPNKAFDLIDNGQLNNNHGGHGKWVATLRNRPKNQPFFFWFASTDAHRGWDADREWKPQYGPPHTPEHVEVPPFLVDDQPTRRDLASYYNEVTRFDYYIGQVVNALKEEKLYDNTVILVLADNGRPFPRAKTRLHDSGMKTALVGHWPNRIKTPAVTDSLVSAIDIAPTLLRLAGIQPGPTFQGTDFSSLFSQPKTSIRRFAFSEHNWHDYEAHGRSVRDQSGFVLISNQRPEKPWQGPADSVRSPSHQSLLIARQRKVLTVHQRDVFAAPRKEYELFNSRTDPDQIHNLIGQSEHRAKETELRLILKKWSVQTRDSVPSQLSQDSFDRVTGDRIKSNGYRGVAPGEDLKASMSDHPGPR